MSKKKRGRPAGSSNRDYDVVTVEPTRCPRCGSTRRCDYFHRREFRYDGTTDDGDPYDTIVWRRTKCLDCGRFRIDRSYECRTT